MKCDEADRVGVQTRQPRQRWQDARVPDHDEHEDVCPPPPHPTSSETRSLHRARCTATLSPSSQPRDDLTGRRERLDEPFCPSTAMRMRGHGPNPLFPSSIHAGDARLLETVTDPSKESYSQREERVSPGKHTHRHRSSFCPGRGNSQPIFFPRQY